MKFLCPVLLYGTCDMNMKFFSSSQQIKLPKLIYLSVLGINLSACDMRHSTSEHSNSQIHHSQVATQTDTGKKLSDVAGQATLPEAQHPPSNTFELSEEALRYVGRYHTQMSCEDSFIVCDQGNAEYILTLLADGSAHQTMVGLGRLASESSIKAKNIYRQDRWDFDKHQHEIVVALQEGVDVYYEIEPDHDLKLNLARTIDGNHGENRQYFDQGYPLPKYEYVLKKGSSEE